VKTTGKGAAQKPTVMVVNNDVPTDPKAVKAALIAQADAAIAGAEAKVAKQEEFVATTSGEKQKRQKQHLAGAKEALAQAIAERKELG
jgi:hypothetical protein